MTEIFIGIIIALIIAVITLIAFLIKELDKNKYLTKENALLKDSYARLNDFCKKLSEELEIEKKHTREFAKKYAEMSHMSIDDVLHKLQNDKN